MSISIPQDILASHSDFYGDIIDYMKENEVIDEDDLLKSMTIEAKAGNIVRVTDYELK